MASSRQKRARAQPGGRRTLLGRTNFLSTVRFSPSGVPFTLGDSAKDQLRTAHIERPNSVGSYSTLAAAEGELSILRKVIGYAARHPIRLGACRSVEERPETAWNALWQKTLASIPSSTARQASSTARKGGQHGLGTRRRQLEGFQGKVLQQWSKLTNDDLNQVKGRRDALVGKLQERYGMVGKPPNGSSRIGCVTLAIRPAPD